MWHYCDIGIQWNSLYRTDWDIFKCRFSSGGEVLMQKLLFPSVLNTEVSSFQGVGIEEFHCIQKCPHFRGLE